MDTKPQVVATGQVEDTGTSYPDPVEEIFGKAGRLKVIRKDGVASPHCSAVLIEADPYKTGDDIGKAITRWADENRGALVFDIHIIDTNSVLLIHTIELGKKALRVLERYGQEINKYIAEAEEKEAIAEGNEQENKARAEKEQARLADIGRSYEKRLHSIKKLPDGKVKKKLYPELERGGMHYELFFQALKNLVIADPQNPAAILAQATADELGFGGLLRAEVSTQKEEDTDAAAKPTKNDQ